MTSSIHSNKKATVQIKDGIIIRKSIGTLKHDLRSTQRLIHKLTSAPTQDQDKLTHLTTKSQLLQAELNTLQTCDLKQVKKFDSVYRSVRFFERIKATRQVRSQRNNPSTELDLVYVMHYPIGMRYISLYSKSTTDSTKRSEIKAHLNKLIEFGIIDAKATVRACLSDGKDV